MNFKINLYAEKKGLWSYILKKYILPTLFLIFIPVILLFLLVLFIFYIPKWLFGKNENVDYEEEDFTPFFQNKHIRIEKHFLSDNEKSEIEFSDFDMVDNDLECIFQFRSDPPLDLFKDRYFYTYHELEYGIFFISYPLMEQEEMQLWYLNTYSLQYHIVTHMPVAEWQIAQEDSKTILRANGLINDTFIELKPQ